MNKISTISILLVVSLLTVSCHRTADIHQIKVRIKRDIYQLKKYWNNNNSQAFVSKVNQTSYLKSPTKDMMMISGLRRDVGKITGHLPVEIRYAPKRKRFITKTTMTTRRGNMVLTIVYSQNLQTIGYHIRTQVTEDNKIVTPPSGKAKDIKTAVATTSQSSD